MPDQEPYATPAGVEAAIKAAARAASGDDPSLTVTQRIRLEYFRRFLSRIFSDGNDSEWVLKGGTGMLARIPSTRATLDIDLYRSGFTLDHALDDLRRLAAIDLGDHFRFVYLDHRPSVTGDLQPHVEAYRVSFEVYIGAQRKERINIDLAIGAGLTAGVTTTEPATRLSLPRLTSHPYRLYPLIDQIADKVCAVQEQHGGRPSSREKDLVDLAVIALTQQVKLGPLAQAIEIEARRRGMPPVTTFEIPSAWGPGYFKLAKPIPYLAGHPTAERAAELVAHFLQPAFAAVSNPLIWRPDRQVWA